MAKYADNTESVWIRACFQSIQAQLAKENKKFQYKVAQQFAAKGYPLYYWANTGTAELDFLLQRGSDVVGVEVKKGEHTKSRSLSVFVNEYKPDYSIRLSLKNFGESNGVKAIPLYAAFCV